MNSIFASIDVDSDSVERMCLLNACNQHTAMQYMALLTVADSTYIFDKSEVPAGGHILSCVVHKCHQAPRLSFVDNWAPNNLIRK